MAWDLSDDEVNGVVIAVNTILKGSYRSEGIPIWWDRQRHQLDGKTPSEAVRTDPVRVVELALSHASLGMTAT